jgi:hypothetical protein
MTFPSPDTIAVRAYTQKPDAKPAGGRASKRGPSAPSPWVLVFDTETRIDPSQSLRVGFYQLRKHDELIEEGAFYSPETVSDGERQDLQTYCERRNLTLRTVADFNQYVFVKYGYVRSATIAGFNLPFDISRIAIHHGPARGSMRGGFSFQLCPSRHEPRIQVKHLSRKASLIQFSAPWKQETPRGMRKRGLKVAHQNGHFVDIKTLAAALTSRSFTLESLCVELDVPTRKQASEDHGGPLTVDYLNYARGDVQSTWECYRVLLDRYAKHQLSTPAHKILSEASIGKAYLEAFGIKPLLACQDVPRGLFGTIMSTYYGGRAEVRLRRAVTEVIYTDFKSMYPTVNSLMGLWKFVKADGFEWHDVTQEAQHFLERIERDDFQNPANWTKLHTIVQVKADKDVFPVRAKYDAKINTIGLNYLSSQKPLWYTLADVIAAKLLTGKAPVILKAIGFKPAKPQCGLKEVCLFGDKAFAIHPLKDDAFKRFVDLRDKAKAANDPNQLAIKILANSTSYGIFIEVLRDNAPKPEPIEIYTRDGERKETQSTAIEDPGRYFHPLLGTLITGAARLMLALAERVARDEGLGWAFCDTDSLAMSRPEGTPREDFRKRAARVIDWFEPLNPYEKSGSILQLEDINYRDGRLEPLFALAVSAKRYALFNRDAEGRPIIRKASAHGLGHLMAPYGEDDPATGIPEPTYSLHEIGVQRWQYDLWHKIIEAALSDYPERVPLDYHPTLTTPAASRYGSTSPDLLRWMRHYNASRDYIDQIKPFGFMLSYSARDGLLAPIPAPQAIDPHKRGRPTKAAAPKPSAPFERDPAKGAKAAFDRMTGDPVPVAQLKTYADMLRNYHLSCESKFENGEAWDRGETLRRQVVAESVELIGKEANGVGEFGEAAHSDEAGQVFVTNCVS